MFDAARGHISDRLLVAAGGTLAALTLGLSSPAQAAAAPRFTCQAGAISGSLLTIPLSISEIRDGPCMTRTLDGIKLPPPLSAQLLGAGTSVTETQAVAAASIAGVDIGLGAIPLNLDPLVAGIAPIVIPLPTVLATLLRLPPQITIDVREAVKAALPNGALPLSLAKIGTLESLVSATCQPDGSLTTKAESRLAEVSVLGIKIDTGKSTDQAVPLLDTQNINAANLDLAKVIILTPGINLGLPGLQAFLDTTIKNLLTSLPPIKIPASLAQVRLAVADVNKTATTASASAARLTISLLGNNVLDLILGGAKVAAFGDCPKPVAATRIPAPPVVARTPAPPVVAASIPAALRCTDRRIVLEDVLLQGDRVRLRGFTTRKNAGRKVTLRSLADGTTVAQPTVRKDGSFSATVRRPARRFIGTDKARYRAVVGNRQSFDLKLTRRLQFTQLGSVGSRIRFTGRGIRPVVGQSVEVRQRITCTRWKVIARTRVPASGLVRLAVAKPSKGTEAVYRLTTKVRFSERGSRKLFPTFTTPQSVKLR